MKELTALHYHPNKKGGVMRRKIIDTLTRIRRCKEEIPHTLADIDRAVASYGNKIDRLQEVMSLVEQKIKVETDAISVTDAVSTDIDRAASPEESTCAVHVSISSEESALPTHPQCEPAFMDSVGGFSFGAPLVNHSDAHSFVDAFSRLGSVQRLQFFQGIVTMLNIKR